MTEQFKVTIFGWELPAEPLVDMALETTADELGRIFHAHPTVSETVMEAAEGVHDLTIHM